MFSNEATAARHQDFHMSSILEAFDLLSQNNLKVIVIRQNSKQPLCKGWNSNWNYKEVRTKLQQFPDSNLGLLLGEVIDVEGDSKEANEIINRCVSGYAHPIYQSIKSTHHLFANPDKIRHYRWKDIEFRGYGHQSLLPPSQHQEIMYQWIDDNNFIIPSMPPRLLEFYKQKRWGERQNKDFRKVWCNKCKLQFSLNKNRFNKELIQFKKDNKYWRCRTCRSF